MRIANTSQQLSDLTAQHHANSQTVAMVPTMGALHSGHVSLFRLAHSFSDIVVASIFVNRLQFSDSGDLDKYPRQIAADMAVCEAEPVDVLYLPTDENMFGDSFSTSVEVNSMTQILEGKSRPGHFKGVTTVVAKLFCACRPDVAIFGQKDFQQYAVIKQMVGDLDMPIKIILAPTIREVDGLALSSRNIRLTSPARDAAARLSRGLFQARQAFDEGERSAAALEGVVRRVCTHKLISIDYICVVDRASLGRRSRADTDSVLLLAAEVDGVRLIDNCLLGDS